MLVFINVKSRLAWISPATYSPNEQWPARQAAEFLKTFAGSPHGPENASDGHGIVLHDHHHCYGKAFSQQLKDGRAGSMYVSICSPNLNAYAKRFIQTLQRECPDHFCVFGRQNLDHLLREYLVHYHQERPHQGVGNQPLNSPPQCGPPPAIVGRIVCRERLGGLLKHYYREAA